MSRPDDSIASNFGAPQAGHPSRSSHGMAQAAGAACARSRHRAPRARLCPPIIGRAGRAIIIPDRRDKTTGSTYAPAAQQLSADAATATRARSLSGMVALPVTAICNAQFARYSGAPSRLMAARLCRRPLPTATRLAANRRLAARRGQQQHYAPAGSASGADPHWPGDRCPIRI